MFELLLVPVLLVAVAIVFRNYPTCVIAFVTALLLLCTGILAFIGAYFALVANPKSLIGVLQSGSELLSDVLLVVYGLSALGMIAIFVVLILY
jgi:hypothetical protein